MQSRKRKFGTTFKNRSRRSAWTKSYKRTKGAPAATKTSVARLTSMVRSVRPELKCKDYTIGTTDFDYYIPLANSNANYIINTPPISDDMNGRNGRKIFVKSFQMRLQMRLPQPDTVNELAQSMRICVLWDKSLNGVYPPGSTGSAGSSVALDSIYFKGLTDPETGILSPLNLDFRDRVVILSDDIVTSSPKGQNIANYKKYLRVNRETIFNAGTTDNSYSTIVSGALIVCLIPTRFSANAAETAPRIQMQCRVRYTDA